MGNPKALLYSEITAYFDAMGETDPDHRALTTRLVIEMDRTFLNHVRSQAKK